MLNDASRSCAKGESLCGDAADGLNKAIDELERELNLADRRLELLKMAAARIMIANDEGDPILSAWLPDALAAIRGDL